MDLVSVQSYEKGENKLTVKELEMISNVLDIPLIVLLHGGGEVEMLQRNGDGAKCKWKKY